MQNHRETLSEKKEYSPFFQLLVTCCHTATNSDEILSGIEKSLPSTASVIEFTALAEKQGVLPLVYDAIKTIPEAKMPSGLLETLRHYTRGITTSNMLMTATLIRIMRLFELHHIDALAFKGATLSQMAYGNIGLRQFGDIDILIQKSHRKEAVSLLIQEGYIPEISLKPETERGFYKSVNVIGLYHGTNGIYVEIHWELLAKNYAVSWNKIDLWQPHTACFINHIPLRTLNPEILLLYLCVHGSKHFFERLEWICDIDRTLRKTPDLAWETLCHTAEQLGIARMLCLGLLLSKECFDTPLPLKIRQKCEKDPHLPHLLQTLVSLRFSDKKRTKRNYGDFLLLLKMREKFSDRLLLAWRALSAPKFDDFVYLQLPSYATFLYPAVRLTRLLGKYIHL